MTAIPLLNGDGGRALAFLFQRRLRDSPLFEKRLVHALADSKSANGENQSVRTFSPCRVRHFEGRCGTGFFADGSGTEHAHRKEPGDFFGFVSGVDDQRSHVEGRCSEQLTAGDLCHFSVRKEPSRPSPAALALAKATTSQIRNPPRL